MSALYMVQFEPKREPDDENDARCCLVTFAFDHVPKEISEFKFEPHRWKPLCVVDIKPNDPDYQTFVEDMIKQLNATLTKPTELESFRTDFEDFIISARDYACPCQYYEIIQHARDTLGNAEVSAILEKYAEFGSQNP